MAINPNNRARPTPTPSANEKPCPKKTPAEETPPAVKARIPDLNPNEKKSDRQQQLLEVTKNLEPEKKETDRECDHQINKLYFGDNFIIKP